MKNTILFLILFLCSDAYATHLVGGEISYACNNYEGYDFTLNVYRDCEDFGAQFDSFNGGVQGTVSIFDGTTLVTNINLDAPTIENIDFADSDHPCPAGENLCVEKGTYIFSANLPLSDNDYTITYSRCCRSESVHNIRNGDNLGMTFTISLNEEVQQIQQTACNNSPIFENPFVPAACVFEPLSMDLSATDVDGDELRYYLSAPLVGGGLSSGNNGGNTTDLDGIAPNPDAAPPYNDIVDFVSPLFTVEAPLRGDPLVTLDSITGIFSGTPNILGQYALAVTVEEYRKGVLLSTTLRQILINVSNCDGPICNTTSTFNQNKQSKELRLQPNPSTGVFSIVQQDFNIDSYKVYDVHGKVLIENQNNSEQINLSNHSAGIYIVQILSTQGEIFSGKLIKQ